MLPVSSKVFTAALALALASALGGCAAQPPPRFVRAADLGKGGPLAPGQALVVEFDVGDTIPLNFTLDGPFVESPKGAPPIPLRVIRHFYLRIDKDGLKSSLDGKNFDWKSVTPGRFQFGVGVTPAGAAATMSIHTPVPPGLPK